LFYQTVEIKAINSAI